ncbi:hypothetical protein L195_g046490, partial [Trifolium pratense]
INVNLIFLFRYGIHDHFKMHFGYDLHFVYNMKLRLMAYLIPDNNEGLI